MADNFAKSPFENLPDDLQAQIETMLVRQEFRKGQLIYVEGQPATGLSWQRSGIMLIHTDQYPHGYGLAWPAYRGVWGGPSSFSGAHAAKFRAVTKCTFDVLPQEAVHWLSNDPRFTSLVGEFTARDVAMTIAVSSILNEPRADTKLRRFLLAVGQHAASGADPFANGELVVPWPFSKAELARMLGLSRPHLSSLFNEAEPGFPVRIVDRSMVIAPSVFDKDHHGAVTAEAKS